MRKVDVVGTGLLVTSRFPRHGYVGRRGSRDVHQYRRRPTIVNLFVGQTERSSHGVPSESNQPCRDRRLRPRTAVAGKLRTRVSRRSQHGPMPRTLSPLSPLHFAFRHPVILPSPSLSRRQPVLCLLFTCCACICHPVVLLLSCCCPLRLKANLRLCSTHFSACRACTSGVPTGLDSLGSVAASTPALSASLSIILPSG
jgi:hypothetical protein